MRIKKNDIFVDVYSFVSSIGADGMNTPTYSIKYQAMPADVQPIGSKLSLEAYGLNTTGANAKKLFYDTDFILLENDCILTGGKLYQVKNISPWYTHNRAIIEPYDGDIV
jgi:hypothetical protein